MTPNVGDPGGAGAACAALVIIAGKFFKHLLFLKWLIWYMH